MSNLSDLDYYQRRHEQERQRAEQAEKPEARSVHSQLADEYAKRIQCADAGRSRPTPRVAASA